jgi:transcriptional regulator with XRE-family HTH domain
MSIEKKIFSGMIPSKLKYYRSSKNISQEDIAKRLGLTKPNISNWENGKKAVPFKYFSDIAKILNVEIEDLCDDITEKYKDKIDLQKINIPPDALTNAFLMIWEKFNENQRIKFIGLASNELNKEVGAVTQPGESVEVKRKAGFEGHRRNYVQGLHRVVVNV